DVGTCRDRVCRRRTLARRDQECIGDVWTGSAGVLRRASLSDSRRSAAARCRAGLCCAAVSHSLPLLPKGLRRQPGRGVPDLARGCCHSLSVVSLGSIGEGASHGLVAQLCLTSGQRAMGSSCTPYGSPLSVAA